LNSQYHMYPPLRGAPNGALGANFTHPGQMPP
jgi:hypothetical protein